MSYSEVVAGLKARYATLSAIKVRLDGEPTAVQDSPLIYTVLDSFKRAYKGTVVEMRYRLMSRLCIRWQYPEQSEATLISLVNAIPLAIDADWRLSGAARGASVQTGDAGWVSIGGIEYRTLDFYIEVLEVGALESGAV
jgi:hypothetical protein